MFDGKMGKRAEHSVLCMVARSETRDAELVVKGMGMQLQWTGERVLAKWG